MRRLIVVSLEMGGLVDDLGLLIGPLNHAAIELGDHPIPGEIVK